MLKSFQQFFTVFYKQFATIFRTLMSFFKTLETKRLSLLTQAV